MSIHTHTNLLVHIVWSTYKRTRCLDKPLRIKLNAYLQSCAASKSIRIITSYINADHIHILINQDPAKSVASVVMHLKGNTSRWLNPQPDLSEKFKWGRGYGAFSVSPAHRKRITNYINNQHSHHHHHPTSVG